LNSLIRASTPSSSGNPVFYQDENDHEVTLSIPDAASDEDDGFAYDLGFASGDEGEQEKDEEGPRKSSSSDEEGSHHVKVQVGKTNMKVVQNGRSAKEGFLDRTEPWLYLEESYEEPNVDH
jgi:hypothetical protein